MGSSRPMSQLQSAGWSLDGCQGASGHSGRACGQPGVLTGQGMPPPGLQGVGEGCGQRADLRPGRNWLRLRIRAPSANRVPGPVQPPLRIEQQVPQVPLLSSPAHGEPRGPSSPLSPLISPPLCGDSSAPRGSASNQVRTIAFDSQTPRRSPVRLSLLRGAGGTRDHRSSWLAPSGWGTLGPARRHVRPSSGHSPLF